MFTFDELLRDYLICNQWKSEVQAALDLVAHGMTHVAAQKAVDDNSVFMLFNASDGDTQPAATEQGGKE